MQSYLSTIESRATFCNQLTFRIFVVLKAWIKYGTTLMLVVLLMAGTFKVTVFTMSCHFSGKTMAELSPITHCLGNESTEGPVFKTHCCDFAQFGVSTDENYLPTQFAFDLDADIAWVAQKPVEYISAFLHYLHHTFQFADLPPPNILAPTTAQLQVFLV